MKADVSFSGANINVKFDLEGIIDSMTDEELADMAQSLSCRDAIIRAVCDQLCDGFTENVSSGFDSTLAEARRSIMDRVEQFQTRANIDRKREVASVARRAYLDGVYAGLDALCGPRREWGNKVFEVRDAVVSGFDDSAYEVR